MATIASRVTTLETKVKALETASASQGQRITALESLVTAMNNRLKVVEDELSDPLPEPEPEPDPEQPPLTGWPDATNTGAKGTLTNSSSITTNAHGQVIENKNITGQIIVKHNNVVIRNCKITGPANDVMVWIEGNDCTVEDCTLIGTGSLAGARGVWFEGVTQTSANRGKVLRCNISKCEDSIVLGTGSHHIVKDNFINNLMDYRNSGDPHVDGIQLHGGSGNYSVIEHNNIAGYPEISSSMTCGNRAAGQGAVGLTIKNNRMNGGTSVLYIEGSDSRDNVVSGNLMGNGVFGFYISGTGIDGATYSGNVDINTGAPIL